MQEAATRAIATGRVRSDAPACRAWLPHRPNAALDELRRSDSPFRRFAGIDLWGFDDARIAKITVEQGLAVLPPTHREIISLIDIAGFSYGEAAELLNVPVRTIMSRIARARNALLAVIESSSIRPLKSSHGY